MGSDSDTCWMMKEKEQVYRVLGQTVGILGKAAGRRGDLKKTMLFSVGVFL